MYHCNVRTLLALTLLGAAALASPPAHAAPPVPQGAAHAMQGTEALLRLADRLRRLVRTVSTRATTPSPRMPWRTTDPGAYAAALQRPRRGAVRPAAWPGRDLPSRLDLRRDTAALPLGPWIAELGTAAEPAAVIDRAALLPPEAAALKRALAGARARAAAGGLPTVPPMPGNDALEPGASDPVRVPALRARLAATDPVAAALRPTEPELFDEDLVAAVRRFQAAEALEADGRAGRMTFAALNRPAEATIRQLRVALDMRRAAAAPGPERRIEVNIPYQRLQVIEAGRVQLDMAVIVGKPARATPMLRVRLTSVMFNPPWGVPERNAREDLLPRFRSNPRAMMEKGFRVYGFAEGQRVEIDPDHHRLAFGEPGALPLCDPPGCGRCQCARPDQIRHPEHRGHLHARHARSWPVPPRRACLLLRLHPAGEADGVAGHRAAGRRRLGPRTGRPGAGEPADLGRRGAAVDPGAAALHRP